MKPSCPRCGSAIAASDVNLDRLVAKCASCNDVFRFDPGRASPKPAPAQPPLPKGIEVLEQSRPHPREGTYREVAGDTEGGKLVVRRRWFDWIGVFMLAFACVWNVMLGRFYAGALTRGDSWAMFLPLLHVGVGVSLTYSSLGILLNSTVLRIENGRLTVRAGPLPWLGSCDADVASLRQIYVRRRMARRRDDTTSLFSVCAETHDRRELVLVDKLTDRAQADYLEWVIEDHLGIENDPGRGD